MKQSVKEYVNAVKIMIKTEGWEAANIANHKALEINMITLEQFQAAARIITKAFFNRLA